MDRLEASRAVPVGMTGLVIGLLIGSVTLAIHGWDPAGPLMVGVEAAPRGYVEERLGDIPLTSGTGHDGKYFFVQSHDPLLLEPSAHAALMDRPTYRAQRMLYPVIVSWGSWFGEDGIVWLMLAVNVFAIGVGSWATAAIALSIGASRWLGLAFALNPGLWIEVAFDGSGAVAWALFMVGVFAVLKGRWVGAIVTFCLAVLGREIMYMPVAGVAVYLWPRDRRRAVQVLTAPLFVLVSWAWWVRRQLEVPLWTVESNELGLPFVGFAQALRQWLQGPDLRLVVGMLAIVVVVVAMRQAVSGRELMALIGVGIAVVAIFLRGHVWYNHYDNTRAIAPLFTTVALVWAIRRSSARVEP